MLMIGKQLTAEQRLTKAVVAIMGNPKYVALSGVLMIGNREVTDDPSCTTAYTDGRNEKYARAFIDSLNDAELRFLVLHECYHKLYKHLTTWQWMYDENAPLANQACDYAINIRIADDNTDGFATMPKDGLIDPKYRGMDSAAIYKLLRQEQPPQPTKPQGNGDEGEGDNEGEGGDEGEGEGEDGDEGTGIQKPANKPVKGNGKGKPDNTPQGFDHHDWEAAKGMDPEEKHQLERDLDEAIRQGALAAGKLGTGGNRELEELLKTKIDWREALREFINSTCAGNEYSTWKRPNRRFISSGVYLPSGINEKVGELVIAIDTSGSIGGREIAQFLGEVKAICETVQPEAVRLLYWDTKVCGDEKYAGPDVENLVKSTKPRGGGGTDVNCVCKYIDENAIKAQAVVVLTDGYLGGSWGDWSMPVLWCIVGNESVVPDVGKVVYVEWE